MFDQGRPLFATERAIFEPYFQPSTLQQVRIVDGNVPFWLRKCMCAVVLGTRIYFRKDAYQIGSVRGVELLAHELTHVEQFLNGMTIIGYLWASRHGYKNNPYEIEAYAKGAFVCQCIAQSQKK